MIQVILIFLLSLSFSRPAFAEWSVWDTLGGVVYSAPSACTVGNWTFVFVKSGNEMIFRKRWLPTGSWSSIWEKVPAMRQGNATIYSSGAPAVYCFENSDGQYIALYVIGDDRRVWSTSVALNGGWRNWFVNTRFTAALRSGPAVASWNGGQTHIFVRGEDNRIYMQILGETGLQLFISEQTPNDPVAVWSSRNRLELFYRDNLGRIWHQYKINNTWYPRQFIPTGETHGSLAVVSRNSTTLDLFTRGPGSTLVHKQFANGVWSNWMNLGGQSLFGPGATVYANSNRMMVFFALKSDGTLRYRAWAP